MIRPGVRIATTALVPLSLAVPAGAGTGNATNRPVLSRLLLPYEGDQDEVLAVSSIEWGGPDRLSFTARYVHMFDRKAERDTKPWLSNLTATPTPGIAGGRLGIGYQGNLSRRSSKPGPDLALTIEARAVLLRTWARPLMAGADRTFASGEVRTSLAGVLIVGVGHYRRVSGVTDHRGTFWGYHVGLGM